MTQRDVKGSRTPDLGTRSHQPDGCWSGSACGQQRSAESRVAHVLMITADGGRGTHSSSMRRTLRTGAELPTSTYAVHSLERAASLLRSFSAAEPELTIGELARRTNLPRSTVHRLVVNLMRLGFLARDARTERYRLGLLLAELGTIALSRMGLREKARPIMVRLAEQTGEVVCLAVVERNRSMYVEVVEGRHGLRLRATVGSSAPLHASATGTVLLAYMPEAEVRRLAVETGLPKLTARTITRIEPLLERLAAIRARGFSIDEGESEEGLTGLAAPVRPPGGAVVGALVIAGPGARVLADEGRRWAPVVVAAASEISAGLGEPFSAE